MVWVPPESDSEIRIQEQANFIWELTPGKFIQEWRRKLGKGKKPIKAAQRILHDLHKLSNLAILNDLCKLITLFN